MKLGDIFSLIGLGILAYMLNKIGFSKISFAVQSINPAYLAGFFGVLTLTVFLKGLKWRASLGIFNIQIGVLQAVEMWTIGFFMGALTPGRVGDFAKVFYLEGKKSRSLGAVFFDRMTDVLAVALFAAAGIGVFGSIVGLTYPAAFLIGVLALSALFIIAKHRNAFTGMVLRMMVPEKYRGIFRKEMGTFYHSITDALKNRAAILNVLIMAISIWALSVFQGLFIAKSLGIDISYTFMLLILSIAALLELVPVTVAGLGTREGGVVVMMSYLGIASEKALVFSLSGFLFGYITLAIAGYLLWLRNPIKTDFKHS